MGIRYNILFEDLHCSFSCTTYLLDVFSTTLQISKPHRFMVTTSSHITSCIGSRECEEDPFFTWFCGRALVVCPILLGLKRGGFSPGVPRGFHLVAD